MKEKQTQLWIPLYVDKWIFGSTRIELEPAERGVFVDLMALAAKDGGYIRANETTPYLATQLAGLLNIPMSLLESTLKKCIHYKKVEMTSEGIYHLVNWEGYKLSEDYKYRLETGRRGVPGPSVRENPDKCPTKAGPIREDRIREDRIGKEKIEEGAGAPARKRFTVPSIEEVREYIVAGQYPVDPDRFHTYYESKGWTVGKSPMKDWKAAVRTWVANSRANAPSGALAPAKGKYEGIGRKVGGGPAGAGQ